MKNVFNIVIVMIILTSCNTKMNDKKIKSEILTTVKAHNNAWAVKEDINEQLKYVHDSILSIAPPYQKIIHGKEEYKNAYLIWMKHATVDYFKELNPEITLLDHKQTAFVVFRIEMSFKYDLTVVDNWKGLDFMTLAKQKGKWKIISDMYVETK